MLVPRSAGHETDRLDNETYCYRCVSLSVGTSGGEGEVCGIFLVVCWWEGVVRGGGR